MEQSQYEEFVRQIKEEVRRIPILPPSGLSCLVRSAFDECGLTYQTVSGNGNFSILITPGYSISGNLVQMLGGEYQYSVAIHVGEFSSEVLNFPPETIKRFTPRLLKLAERLRVFHETQELSAKRAMQGTLLQGLCLSLLTDADIDADRITFYSDERQGAQIHIKILENLDIRIPVDFGNYEQRIRRAIDSYRKLLQPPKTSAHLLSAQAADDGKLRFNYKQFQGFVRTNRHFVCRGHDEDFSALSIYPEGFKPFNSKSDKQPKSRRLVDTLARLNIEYGYTDNGEFIIQLTYRANRAICWNENKSGYFDAYHLSPSTSVQDSPQRTFSEKMSETDMIRFFSVLVRHGAYVRQPKDYGPFKPVYPRERVLIETVRNLFPEGLTVYYDDLDLWAYKGPELNVQIAPGQVIKVYWRRFAHFLTDIDNLPALGRYLLTLRTLFDEPKDETEFI